MLSVSDQLLDVKDLQVHFLIKKGVVRAVDGVSFSVHRGETVGLVGESGCGKSITALAILGLVPKPAGKVVGGKIIFEGQDLLDLPENEMRRIRGKRVAIILQDPLTSLNPCYCIGEQIAEVFRAHQHIKGDKLRSKIIEGLGMVKIPSPEARMNDYPHQMSGGMRQRVGGVIALACEPSLLIADEPTTSLDVTTQAQYLRLLKSLQEEKGMGMLFITHDLGIIARMCDRVVVMYAGKSVEVAPTLELFDSPLHPYTKALLSCLPRLGLEGGRLLSIDGEPPEFGSAISGCSFAPRCSSREDKCSDTPDMIAVSEDHQVRCWRVKQKIAK